MDFCLPVEHIHENDIPPLTILISQCKFNSIFFYGNNPDKNESYAMNPNKNKSTTIKKLTFSPNNTSSSNFSLNEGRNKKNVRGDL